LVKLELHYYNYQYNTKSYEPIFHNSFNKRNDLILYQLIYRLADYQLK